MNEQSSSKTKVGQQRRKILGWLGLGAIGTMIFRIVPMKKAVSRRLLRKNEEKISIAINKYSVKRNKKVMKNV
ncbi:MAG TPA: hypothetical protein VLX91_13130 [Candidatus Acidoferrales bacterium]|nr:hypothetical protein [Candidatus Acidoferrales bacterium]